jgi:4-hydroxy-3-polyprenylbenzoate decarboxylase
MIDFHDLREWLQKVEQLGELKTVYGADWDLEIGAVASMVSKNPQKNGR